MADTGGFLGLFIGVSVCTVLEVVEFVIDIIIYLTARNRRRKQVDAQHTTTDADQWNHNGDGVPASGGLGQGDAIGQDVGTIDKDNGWVTPCPEYTQDAGRAHGNASTPSEMYNIGARTPTQESEGGAGTHQHQDRSSPADETTYEDQNNVGTAPGDQPGSDQKIGGSTAPADQPGSDQKIGGSTTPADQPGSDQNIGGSTTSGEQPGSDQNVGGSTTPRDQTRTDQDMDGDTTPNTNHQDPDGGSENTPPREEISQDQEQIQNYHIV